MLHYNTYTRWLSLAAVLFVLLMGLSGCSEYHDNSGNTSKTGTKGGWITFSAEIPGEKIPITRGMDGGNENVIRTLDLLVFDATDPELKCLQRIMVPDSDFSYSGTTVSFKAFLDSQPGKVQIVLLANARNLMGDPNVNGSGSLWWFKAGDRKESFMWSALISSGNDPAGWKWNTSDSGFTPIPMYGEIELNGITPNSAPVTGIQLIRMLARIDIQNSADNFTLETIHVLNYYSAGFLAPAFDNAGNIVAQDDPMTPSDSYRRTGAGNALSYAYDPEESNGLYAGEIYVYESPKTVDGGSTNPWEDTGRINGTCLILEGKYNNTNYFYRVDFAGNDATDPTDITYMPLKRNHKYIVNISRVDGKGFTSIEDALNSYTMVSNLKTRIISYDQSKLSSIVYNGQYMLGVGNDDVNLSGDWQEIKIPAFTDAPDGWKASFITPTEGFDLIKWDNGWQVMNEVTGNPNDHEWGEINIRAQYLGGGTRTGTIRFTANYGRLEILMTLTQTYTGPGQKPALSIELYDEYGVPLPKNGDQYYIEFSNHIQDGVVPPKRIYYRSTGADKTYVYLWPMSWVNGSNDTSPRLITYIPDTPNPSGNQIPIVVYPGDATWTEASPNYTDVLRGFDIQPAAKVAGQENSEFEDVFQFRAISYSPAWQEQSAILKIYQSDWMLGNIIPECILGNMEYKIEVKAKAPWRVASITENRTSGPSFVEGRRNLLAEEWNTSLFGTSTDPYLKVGATGGQGATSLAPVTSSLNILTEKWVKGLEGTVTVKFESTDGSNKSKSITFRVFEHHLDYTSEDGVNTTDTPFFWAFPAYRLTTDYVYSSSDPAYARVCTAIGEGWRLPTMNEAMLMSAYRQSLLADPSGYFGGSGPGSSDYNKYGFSYYHYWTSSVYAGNSRNYHLQYITGYGAADIPQEAIQSVRCIYTPGGPAEYDQSSPNVPNKPAAGGKVYPWVDTSDAANGPIIVSRETSGRGVNGYSILPPGGSTSGTISDMATNRVAAKLQVANTDLPSTLTWAAARTECAKLTTGGGGWRLPTYREMMLIGSSGALQFPAGNEYTNYYGLGNITSSQGFTRLNGEKYWTETLEDTGQTKVWSIALFGMWVSIESKTELISARCVRSVE